MDVFAGVFSLKRKQNGVLSPLIDDDLNLYLKRADSAPIVVGMGPMWDVNLGFDNAITGDYGGTHDPTGWLFAPAPRE